ncbi:MAG: histidinol-phosphate transaminase [Gammaproteobacteria bacterium]|nr:MAG: histidinol-phosphate transaminase [Gammaproteobacteria bacterium]
MSQNKFIDLACDGVKGLNPYQPGKPISELEREYGVTDIIKLASNENPLGPSKKAMQAMQEAMQEIQLYPDGNGFELKKAIAEKFGFDLNQITLGNGSNDILELIARVFLTPADESLFSQYSFAVYPLATQAVGASMNIVSALPEDNEMPLGHDLAAMQAAISDKTKVIFVANPNNPTGTWLKAADLEAFIAAVPQNIIVVVDEAYFEYVQEAGYPDCSKLIVKYPNLIVTRTFSKAHGLAGVRVGFSISHPDIADLLNRVRQPFNVNTMAQAAAVASLADDEHIAASVASNSAGLKQIMEFCDAKGVGYIPSVGNFICIKVGSNNEKLGAAEIDEQLLRNGIIVRPVANYKMPEYLRVTVGTKAENDRLLKALEKIMNL